MNTLLGRRPFSVIAAVMLLMAVIMPAAVFAGQQRRQVCHLNRDGSYIMLSVTSSAVAGHLAHGDGLPGMNGFTESCELDVDEDGVPDGDDNCVNTPNPDQSNRYGSGAGDACEDSDGDGTPDVEESHICVSIDSVVILRPPESLAFCFSTDSVSGGEYPNIAVANGEFAQAYANYNQSNSATAIGDDAYSEATGGIGNTTLAIGEGAEAVAAIGNNNNSTAIGDGSFAYIAQGNDNTATAIGAAAFAQTGGPDSHNNTAMATGDRAVAYTEVGSDNVATASSSDATAYVSEGDGNIVTSSGLGAYASVEAGSGNLVTANADSALAKVINGNHNIVTANGDCDVIVANESGQTVSCP